MNKMVVSRTILNNGCSENKKEGLYTGIENRGMKGENDGMSEDHFEEYMSKQVDRIKQYREHLKQELGREVSVNEAARRWIQEYAEQFQETHREQQEQR